MTPEERERYLTMLGIAPGAGGGTKPFRADPTVVFTDTGEESIKAGPEAAGTAKPADRLMVPKTRAASGSADVAYKPAGRETAESPAQVPQWPQYGVVPSGVPQMGSAQAALPNRLEAATSERKSDTVPWNDVGPAGFPVLRRGGAIVDTAPDGLSVRQADKWRTQQAFSDANALVPNYEHVFVHPYDTANYALRRAEIVASIARGAVQPSNESGQEAQREITQMQEAGADRRAEESRKVQREGLDVERQKNVGQPLRDITKAATDLRAAGILKSAETGNPAFAAETDLAAKAMEQRAMLGMSEATPAASGASSPASQPPPAGFKQRTPAEQASDAIRYMKSQFPSKGGVIDPAYLTEDNIAAAAAGLSAMGLPPEAMADVRAAISGIDGGRDLTKTVGQMVAQDRLRQTNLGRPAFWGSPSQVSVDPASLGDSMELPGGMSLRNTGGGPLKWLGTQINPGTGSIPFDTLDIPGVGKVPFDRHATWNSSLNPLTRDNRRNQEESKRRQQNMLSLLGIMTANTQPGATR